MRDQDDDDYALINGKWVLKDGRRARFRTTVMDASPIAADGMTLDSHRPGYRISDQAAQDDVRRARDEMIARNERACKSDARREVDTETAAEIGRHATDADPRAASYDAMVRRVSEMWRQKDPLPFAAR